MHYDQLITIEAGKRGGKPCIRGLRTTVYDVLKHLAGGMTKAEIIEDFYYCLNRKISLKAPRQPEAWGLRS